MEIYKCCPSFPGYSASNLGNIKGPSGRILSQRIGSRGYWTFRRRGDKRTDSHGYILDAWVGPRPPEHEACHGPLGRLINTPDNLRWGTRSENAQDRVKAGNNGNHRGIPSPIRRVRRSDGQEWKSASEAARDLGLIASCISRVCVGRRKTYAGYKWEYLPQN